jgi:hypothetical protein
MQMDTGSTMGSTLSPLTTVKDLKNLSIVADELEAKTTQMASFESMYSLSVSSDAINRPEPALIQGPHDRLAAALAKEVTRRALEVSAMPMHSWAGLKLPEDDLFEYVRERERLKKAVAAARAKLGEVERDYADEVGGCGTRPTREISLHSMSLTGRVTTIHVLPDDGLDAVKGKLQSAEGIPADQINLFVTSPRKQDVSKVVYATQIRGATDLIKHKEYVHVWEKLNSTAGLQWWEDGDTAASFALHDGAEIFHFLTLDPGRSPLCSPAEQAEQDKLGRQWMKADMKAFRKKVRSGDRSTSSSSSSLATRVSSRACVLQ